MDAKLIFLGEPYFLDQKVSDNGIVTVPPSDNRLNKRSIFHHHLCNHERKVISFRNFKNQTYQEHLKSLHRFLQ